MWTSSGYQFCGIRRFRIILKALYQAGLLLTGTSDSKFFQESIRQMRTIDGHTFHLRNTPTTGEMQTSRLPPSNREETQNEYQNSADYKKPVQFTGLHKHTDEYSWINTHQGHLIGEVWRMVNFHWYILHTVAYPVSIVLCSGTGRLWDLLAE